MDSADEKEELRRVMSRLGKIMTPAKAEALARNREKSRAVLAAPVSELEKAYKLWKAGKTTLSRAARDHALCSYPRMKAYAARRDAGETMSQITNETH